MDTSLRCSRCGKLFDKVTTHKRHGYYCRSRLTGQITSRKRSCISCTRAKTRCDCQFARCSRCEIKGIECQYSEVTSSNVPVPLTELPEDVAGTCRGSDMAQLLARDDDALSKNLTLLGSATPPSFPFNFEVNDDDVFASTIFSSKEDFPFFSDVVRTPPKSIVSPAQAPTPISFQSQLTIPPSPPCLPGQDPPRSLIPRKMATTSSQTSSMFLTQIICSFPTMMLRKETLPPFIHPRCFSTVPGQEDDLPEALVNCMSLARMFATRTKGTNKLLWRTIRMEHERLWSEHNNFNDWDLLAAVQALLIYAIMQVIDGEVEQNNLDVPLLLSLGAIASTLHARVGARELKDAVDGQQADWRDWIFHESGRRFVIVTRIMNMLFNMDHAVTCTPLPGFVLMPLPAKKTLWEANSAAHWQDEFDVALHAREIYGVTTESHLVRLQQRSGKIITSPAAWEEWLATSDGLGTAVMIAASLLNT